jgi:hypothetical protein
MRRITLQKCVLMSILTLSFAAVAPTVFSQAAGANPELQQKVAALKQSIAVNQQALHYYTWVETKQMIFKGETKSTTMSQCQYGPDGTVQKTALGAPQPPPAEKRGLRGKVVEKKKGEMKDYMESVGSLIKLYVPPKGSQLQTSLQSGKASIQPLGGGLVTLVFHDYAIPGDTVTLTFDTAGKKIRAYNVNTYLDSPSEVVTLKVVFESLPDGTNHVAQSVLDATAKQIQIRTTNSGYNKLQ